MILSPIFIYPEKKYNLLSLVFHLNLLKFNQNKLNFETKFSLSGNFLE